MTIHEKYNGVRPSHDIDPRDKIKDDFLLANAQYFYDRYKNDLCTISRSSHDYFAELKTYMDGTQDTTQYRPMLGLDKSSKDDGWYNIDWESRSNPMPKIVKKIQGMFLSEDHSVVASAISEKARAEKIKRAHKDHLKKKFAPKLKQMQQITGVEDLGDSVKTEGGFVGDSEDEATMISNFVSEKLSYEIGSEKVIDYTIKGSEYNYDKAKSIYDLIRANLIVNKDVIDEYTGKIKWKYVDIEDFFGEFHQNSDSLDWAAEFEQYTISDIRKIKPDIKEDELALIAKRHFNNTYPKGANWNVYNKYYPNYKSYGYDDIKIPVISFSFKSVDSYYKKKVKIENGEYRLYDADFGKNGKDIEVNTEESIYEGAWIVDTDYLLYGGMMTNIPRDSSGMVKLPYHVLKLDGKSICENSIPVVNQMALLNYKLQNAWAKAVPDSYSFDFSSLEDIADASDNKLDPFDLITMFFQSSGMPHRSEPMDADDTKARRNAPVEKIYGGIGTFLEEYMVTRKSLKEELAELTGLSSVEVPSGQATATETRLAVSSMSDVLKPLYVAYISIKEELAFNTIVRIQILFKHNKEARKSYENIIGKGYVDALKSAFVTDPMEIGITFEAKPSDTQKQAVIDAAQQALKVGRDGRSILKWSEYLYIVEKINTQSGLKEARALIAKRESDEEKRDYARQQAAMEHQSQMQAQQQQAKVQAEVAKDQATTQHDMKENQQKSQLEIDEYRKKKEIDAGLMGVEKGIDMEIERNKQQT